MSHLLHLMRHGAPEVPDLLLGWHDMASTEEGISGCLDKARNLSIQHVISSDLIRASAPAEAIADSHGLTTSTDKCWRELHFGAWDGLAPDETDQQLLQRFHEDPDAYPPPGGESWSTLVERVKDAIDTLPTQDTLVVTHGGAMRAALAVLFCFTQQQTWSFDFPYCALLSLRIWTGPQRVAQIVGLIT